MAIILKPENVARFVFLIRSEKVMIDADLAMLYGVTTKALNQAAKRNSDRFPLDFMFRLTKKETESLIFQSGRSNRPLRSQFVTSNQRGGRRYRPYAFTEQGVAMLSSVLRSQRAVEVNIAIMPHCGNP